METALNIDFPGRILAVGTAHHAARPFTPLEPPPTRVSGSKPEANASKNPRPHHPASQPTPPATIVRAANSNISPAIRRKSPAVNSAIASDVSSARNNSVAKPSQAFRCLVFQQAAEVLVSFTRNPFYQILEIILFDFL